jgi:hypothetical protein
MEIWFNYISIFNRRGTISEGSLDKTLGKFTASSGFSERELRGRRESGAENNFNADRRMS